MSCETVQLFGLYNNDKLVKCVLHQPIKFDQIVGKNVQIVNASLESK